MNVGGYQIIDLKNIFFAGDGEGPIVVIDGIYEKIKATRKPILITGFNTGGTGGKIYNFYGYPNTENSSYVIKTPRMGGTVFSITITNTDEVKVKYTDD